MRQPGPRRFGPGLSRRQLLAMGVAGLAAGAAFSSKTQAAKVATKARIVIVGAGAAGLTVASRLAQQLDGAHIVLLDARKAHYYQPGFTLVAAGLKPVGYPTSSTREWVARGVDWIDQAVAEFDPEARRVVTSDGKGHQYDFLVVATGLELDYAAIEGMTTDLIGREGIGSVYASPEAAQRTWQQMSLFADNGGAGLFMRPATEMKCAGAPLKYAFITDDYARHRGTREKSRLTYAANSNALFGVPIVSEKVRMLFAERGIEVVYNHTITAIDPGRRIATFETPKGRAELGYDFINVVPPMRAPAAVRKSVLAWQSGPLAADGWVEVDQSTLRHARFANVFAIGDVAGVPKGKTAASVKWQAPVVVDHIVADIAGRKSDATYNGYTSCPLITRIGRAMLVEFDYDNNLVPSFPGIIAPLEELWITWLMKEIALKPTYLAMLRGLA